MKTLVLLRHGESTWNRENRFTGWTDVPLSEKGIEEARDAGRLLREGGRLRCCLYLGADMGDQNPAERISDKPCLWYTNWRTT
jgi:hypothetical protein